MIDDFVQDLHDLQEADALIGKIWVKNLACQFGLFVFAGLIAVIRARDDKCRRILCNAGFFGVGLGGRGRRDSRFRSRRNCNPGGQKFPAGSRDRAGVRRLARRPLRRFKRARAI